MCMLSLIWLALGITNGVILSNRMTPFTIYDLSSLQDGLSIVSNYFSVTTMVIAVAAAVALVFLAVGFSGLMVEGMGYNRFFMFTAALSIPVAVLVVLAKRSGMLSAEESGKPPTP